MFYKINKWRNINQDDNLNILINLTQILMNYGKILKLKIKIYFNSIEVAHGLIGI